MPGLPMFGHGQLEGFEEKYGMEYRRAYRDEAPDRELLERHEREIFPLLKRRRLFSGVADFLLYDLVSGDGSVNENVFAYTNGDGGELALVAYNNAYAAASGRIRDSAPYAEKLPGGGRRAARRSLAEALALRGGDKRFLAMRELRSGLWFLRRSSEIAGSGLALVLSGYECQVFLDLFELEDDARGTYAAVHDALAGRGTPDLAWAVQDVVLKDLYAALAALATPSYFGLAALAVRGPAAEPAARPGAEAVGAASAAAGAGAARKSGAAKQSPAAARKAAAKALVEGAAGPALAFYSALRGLIRAEAAEEGLPASASEAAMTAKANAGNAAQPAAGGADEAAAADRARAEALASDAAAAEAARDRLLSGLEALAELARLPEPAGDGGGLIAARLAAPGAAEIAAAYLVLDGVKALAGKEAGEEARRLVDRLCLDRKLREALRAAEVAGDEAHRCLACMKALLARSGARARASVLALAGGALAGGAPAAASAAGPAEPVTAGAEKAGSGKGGRAGAEKAPSPAETALGLFAAHRDDEELRSLLGVNLFDGIEWYAKERFEELVSLGALVFAVSPGSPGGARRKPAERAALAEETARAFLAAELESGYRVDGLGAALAKLAGKD